MRKFLEIAYNGASFHGWQSQPADVSVQQTIEEALSVLLRRPVPVTGAGRTDAGVHARRMFAHFDIAPDCADSVADKRRFLNGLNRLCGRDIAIKDIIDVPTDAHARFDATSRTYKYFVALGKSPFMQDRAWLSPSALDVESMNRAAEILLLTSDFTSFAKLHSDAKTNICKLTHARWDDWHNDFGVPGIVFTVTADRFLRNMVRAMVGTLVDVGRGKINHYDFRRILDRRDRCSAGTSMPPQALFLWDVTYPYIDSDNS